MLVHRILLINIYLEELIVDGAFKVLVPEWVFRKNPAVAIPNLRVQLLKVGIDKPLLGDLNEGLLIISRIVDGEVALAFKRTTINLPHKLYSKGWVARHIGVIDFALTRVSRPAKERCELGLVRKHRVLVWRDIGAAEDGRHNDSSKRQGKGLTEM